MGRTYRHDNKNSWSKPKFKRNKKNKSKTPSNSQEEYDDFETNTEQRAGTRSNEVVEDYESNISYK